MLRLTTMVIDRVADRSHDVLALGTSRDESLARRCGLRPLGHVPVPGGLPGMAQPAVARVATAVRGSLGAPLLLHAWGERAARAAHCADATATVVVLARPPRMTHATVVHARGGGCIEPGAVASATIALGDPLHRALASRAGSAEGLHGVALAADPAALPNDPSAARAAMRARWGASPGEFIMGLVGDVGPSCHARMAMYMLALASVAGRPIRLVMHPAARGAARLVRWSKGLRWGDRHVLRSSIVLDEAVVEPWRSAPGLDAALFFTVPSSDGERQCSGLCLAWTALCGVPTIAEEGATARAMIDDGRTGFVVPSHEHTTGVNRLVRLVDDAALRRTLGEAARQDAIARWSPELFTRRLEEVYAIAAGGRHAVASSPSAASW